MLKKIVYTVLNGITAEKDSPTKVNTTNKKSKSVFTPLTTFIISIILLIIALIVLWKVNPELFYFLKWLLIKWFETTEVPTTVVDLRTI